MRKAQESQLTPSVVPCEVHRESPRQCNNLGKTICRVVGIFASLYAFLLGLDLMGVAFKALGGKGAGQLFSLTANPIAGLMVGVLATVLVQSSSTSTSIVVGLVGAQQLTVHNAIPMIMGANIGTSITNTIVSMAHVGKRDELERAFTGATVHDMFNMLCVLTLLPVELLVGAIQGEGGLLYWMSVGITNLILGSGGADLEFPSPTKEIVNPLTDALVDPDKNVIKALSYGAPSPHDLPSSVNITNCIATNCQSFYCLSAPSDCSKFYCISSSISKVWKKINEDAYHSLQSCDSLVVMPSDACPKDESCYLNAGSFYTEQVEKGRILSSGLLSGLGDVVGGILALILSLALICGALLALVQLLQTLLLGRAKQAIIRATNMNDYLAMGVGAVLTIIVQSSSVVTSSLTPLCGIGVLPVVKMLPLTLGANIGTTFTAMLAALAILKPASLQIAFCHLFFNIVGIMIWFPVRPMRMVIIEAAKMLGFYASYWRVFPLIYIVMAFLILPGTIFGISLLFNVSLVAGILVALVAVAVAAAFVVWWYRGGCYKVVSLEAREQQRADIMAQLGIFSCGSTVPDLENHSEDSRSIYSYKEETREIAPQPQKLGRPGKMRCCFFV